MGAIRPDYLAKWLGSVLPNRTLPSAGGGNGELDSLNLLLIVGLAIFISMLARYLAGRGNGGRKK